jgi:Icc protein
MSPAKNGSAVSWVHFGDLHITREYKQNYQDFLELIDQANANLAGRVDFAVLPGDNADDGTPEQFRLVRAALDRLRIPVHILAGDHDFKSGDLHGFHAVLAAARLPKAVTVSGYRCLFLDVVSEGGGGPDFRLGDRQLNWLGHELEQAASRSEHGVAFMHCYPADLRQGRDEVLALFARHRVQFVDTAHTHYNELINDGQTIYAATRSTGQIEEGPVGFSIAAIDGDVVSWKFKALDTPWPFVQITSPSDYRLITELASPTHLVREACVVRARALSAPGLTAATCRVDNGPELIMAPADGRRTWSCGLSALEDGLHRIAVHALDASGATGEDAITILVSRSGEYGPPKRVADGSATDAVGAWPEKGILGTQLGPNKNGKKW